MAEVQVNGHKGSPQTFYVDISNDEADLEGEIETNILTERRGK